VPSWCGSPTRGRCGRRRSAAAARARSGPRGAEPEVALQHLRGRELDALPRAVHVLVALDVVEAVEQPGHPADPALRQADPQPGESHGMREYSQSTRRTSPSRRTARRWCRRARPTTWWARSTTTRRVGTRRAVSHTRRAADPVAGVQRRQASRSAARGTSAPNPRAEFARTSPRDSDRAATAPDTDDAIRYVPAHSSWCQSLRAHDRERESGSDTRAGSAAPRSRPSDDGS